MAAPTASPPEGHWSTSGPAVVLWVALAAFVLFMTYRMGYMDRSRLALYQLLEDCMASKADERECARRAAQLDSAAPRWALDFF